MSAAARSAVVACLALALASGVFVAGCGAPEERPAPPAQVQAVPVPASATTSTPGGVSLTVAVASATLVAGTSEVATLTLQNSGDATSVPTPRPGIWITDMSGEIVFKNSPRRLRHPITFSDLAAGAVLTNPMTFTVPALGTYLLYAQVSGLTTPPLRFEAAAKSE